MKHLCTISLAALFLSACASSSQAPEESSATPVVKEESQAATAARAAPAGPAAPDKVTLKAKPGNITFNHKAHGERMKCSTCHGQKIASMAPLGRDAGHKLCLDCHKKQKAGPSKCGECHKK